MTEKMSIIYILNGITLKKELFNSKTFFIFSKKHIDKSSQF